MAIVIAGNYHFQILTKMKINEFYPGHLNDC